MKTVMQLLSLILCFELVMGPVQGSLLLPSTALAQDCPAGQEWTSLGRCQVTAETLKMNNSVDICGDDKACLEKNARDKAPSDTSNPFNKNGQTTGGAISSAVAIGIPLLIITTVLVSKAKAKKRGNQFSCKPASLMLMYAAAAALGVGEIYGAFNHKAKLDEIQEKWNSTIVHKTGSSADKRKTEATEAQSQAFEFLAQNEDQVAKTAKTKKGFYFAATGLFAAGAVAAVVEQVKLKKAQAVLKIPYPTGIPAQDAAIKIQRVEAKQTVIKLTCGTDDEAAKADKVDKNQETNDEINAEKQKIKDLEEQKIQNNKDLAKNKAITNCDGNAECIAREQARGQAQTDAADHARKQKDLDDQIKAAKDKMQKLQTPTGGSAGSSTSNPFNGTGPRMDFQNPAPSNQPFGPQPKVPRFESPTKGSATDPRFSKNLPAKDLEKMKQVAAYNISTAKDAEQLLQLINEMDSIELENYTKISYLEEDLAKDLKKVPLVTEISKHIANAFIPNACAADEGCPATTPETTDPAAPAAEPEKKDLFGKILGGAAAFVPMALGLNSILGGVKSKGGAPLGKGELDGTIATTKDKITKAIGYPYTRLAINGVLGGWMGIMGFHMKKVQSESEARAKKLREMKDQFATANGLLFCSEQDRNNTCKPNCYCFTSDNKVNPARAKDVICANTFANLKLPQKKDVSDKVCLDQKQNVDANCACRAKKSCMKISSGLSMSGFSPGTFKMISAGGAPAQDLFNGTVGGADIADSAGINAVNIRKAADAMLGKVDPGALKAKNSFASGLEKGLMASSSGLSMGSGGMSALPTSPAGAAAALDKELKANKEDTAQKAGSQYHGADFNNEAEIDPAAVATDEAGGTEELEIAEVMEKEMDLGDSDINKGSDTNIFDVLSNRYKRSGMRRLFNDQSTAPVDAPSNTELAE